MPSKILSPRLKPGYFVRCSGSITEQLFISHNCKIPNMKMRFIIQFIMRSFPVIQKFLVSKLKTDKKLVQAGNFRQAQMVSQQKASTLKYSNQSY